MQKQYTMLMAIYEKDNPHFLCQSIDSMLKQTIPPTECILVCDGVLTGALEQVLSDYQKQFPQLFRVVRLPENVGLGAALNAGIMNCSCELIARMDSDDVAMPNRCEQQLRCFEENLELDIISGTLLEFQETIQNTSTCRQLPCTHTEIYQMAKLRNPFNHPCVMYKKTSVERAGNYQPFFLFEDYYLWVRMLLSGAKAANLAQPILWMRTGNGMYLRRGGWRYLRSMCQFRWYMRQVGFISWSEFLVGTCGHAVVCLLPNSLRLRFYKLFLRKGDCNIENAMDLLE